jgi:CDP-diacylglycerol--glycerol-3-phosphate 3-phosphatidyltransferase
MSFSDNLRLLFKDVLDFFARSFMRLGISPNSVSIIGLVGNIIASVLIAFGKLQIGGIIVLVMGPLDAVDGTMARLGKGVTAFGAFLDSVSDRYSELFIFGGLLVFFLIAENWTACILVYCAAVGSVLVSYTRARAEALGFNAKIGILTRVERYLVMAPALIINLPIIGLWIIAILANLTALQRIWQVWNQAHRGIEEGRN